MYRSISAAIDFIRAFQQADDDEAGLRQVVDNRVADIVRVIGGLPQFDLADSTQAIVLITSNSPTVFSLEQKTRLIASIRVKSQAAMDAAANAPDSSKEQTCMYVYNYLTENIWDTITNTSIPRLSRIDSFLTHCHNVLGLIYPSPETRKVMTGTILGAEGVKTYGATLCKEAYDNITARNKKLRTNKRPKLKVFPSIVYGFTALYPDAYAMDQQPTDNRTPEELINAIANLTSARKNNKLLKEEQWLQPPSRSSMDFAPMRGGQNAFDMMRMMCMTMQSMQGNSFNQRPPTQTNGRIGPHRRLALEDLPPDGRDDTGSLNGREDTETHDGRTDNRDDRNVRRCSTVLDLPSPTLPCALPSPTLPGAQADNVNDDLDDLLDKKTASKRPAGANAGGGATKVLKRPAAQQTDIALNALKMDSPFPVTCNGCRILLNAKGWRVFPFPQTSKYDKAFPNTGDKDKAWRDLLNYVKKPYVPETSRNKPK